MTSERISLLGKGCYLLGISLSSSCLCTGGHLYIVSHIIWQVLAVYVWSQRQACANWGITRCLLALIFQESILKFSLTLCPLWTARPVAIGIWVQYLSNQVYVFKTGTFCSAFKTTQRVIKFLRVLREFSDLLLAICLRQCEIHSKRGQFLQSTF